MESATLNVCEDEMIDAIAGSEFVPNQRIYSDLCQQAFRQSRGDEQTVTVGGLGNCCLESEECRWPPPT